MSEKLISADKLIQFVENWGKHLGRKEAAYSFLYAIHNAPAVDAVEVVRCDKCARGIVLSHSDNVVCAGRKMPKNGFCSYGLERR